MSLPFKSAAGHLYSLCVRITCLRRHTPPRLTPEGAFIFPSSCVCRLRPWLEQGLDTGSACAGRVPRGVARRSDASRRGPTYRTCLRRGPGAAGRTAALSEAGRADGGGHVCGAQHRGGPQGPHPRCVFRLPRAPDGHLFQRPERQGARGKLDYPGPGTEGREAAQKGLTLTEACETQSRGRRHAGSGESPPRRRIVGSRPPALGAFSYRACAGRLSASGH